MNESALFAFRMICIVGFFLTVIAGWAIHRNRERLFSSKEHPGQSASGIDYTRILVWGVWAHLLIGFALGAVNLH